MRHEQLTAAEADLLVAALAPTPESAIAAWQRWRASTILDELPGEQFLLLPRLYASLLQLHQATEADNRIKGIYRRSWYKNQQTFSLAQSLLADFGRARLPFMLIGGAAACRDFYPHLGERPVDQLDVLTRPEAVDAVLALLTQGGWQPNRSAAQLASAEFRRWVSSVILRRAEQPVPLCLHWRFLPDAPPLTDADLAQLPAAHSTRPAGHAPTPDAATQLVLAGVAAAGVGAPRLVALADMGMMLQHDPAPAWNQVLAAAQFLQAAAALRQALSTIASMNVATIPAAVFSQLDTLARQQPGAAAIDPQRRTGLGSADQRARYHLHRWRRIAGATGAATNAASLVRYLQATAGAERLHSLPWRIFQATRPAPGKPNSNLIP